MLLSPAEEICQLSNVLRLRRAFLEVPTAIVSTSIVYQQSCDVRELSHYMACDAGAQLAGSLRATGYPFVALLAFSGTRTRLVASAQGVVAPGPLCAALKRAADEHGASLVAEQAEHRERVRSCRGLEGFHLGLCARVCSASGTALSTAPRW